MNEDTMPPLVSTFWEQGALVVMLIVVVYTGHKGYWYWSPGVRALTSELARDRDDWRALAVTLLRKQGVDLPEGFEKAPGVVLPGEENNRVSVRRQN
jgi:hypothetical protein